MDAGGGVIGWRDISVALICGFLSILFIYPRRDSFIPRKRGIMLLVLYAAYVLAVSMQ